MEYRSQRTLCPGHFVYCSDGVWRELSLELNGIEVATLSTSYKLVEPVRGQLSFKQLNVTCRDISSELWYEVLEFPCNYMKELYSNSDVLLADTTQPVHYVVSEDSNMFLVDFSCCKSEKDFWFSIKDLCHQRETDIFEFPNDEGDVVIRHRDYNCHWLGLTFLMKESFERCSQVVPRIALKKDYGTFGFVIDGGEPILVKFQNNAPVWV